MHVQIISIIQKTLVADSIRGETGESKKIFSIYNPESKLSVGIPGHSCEQEKAGRSKMVESELHKEPGAEGSVFPESVPEGGGGGQRLILSTHHLLSISSVWSSVKCLLPEVVRIATANIYQAPSLLNNLQPHEPHHCYFAEEITRPQWDLFRMTRALEFRHFNPRDF